jgi:hypothetical protein
MARLYNLIRRLSSDKPIRLQLDSRGQTELQKK